VGTASIYLDANENPFGDGLNRYPDPYHLELKALVAKQKGLVETQIAAGNGSDELLDLIMRVFCTPRKDNVIITPPTFGIYKVLANTNDVEVRESPLDESFQLNPKEIKELADENTKLVFICSPNNPTGNLMNITSVEKLLAELNCVVVIDEAYIDFTGQESWIKRLDEYPNLIVTQTLSKAKAHAAIRLGLCFASPEIISYINKIRLPYNLNTLSQQKAVEVLSNPEPYQKYVEAILSERKGFGETFASLLCVKKVFPTDANFFLVQFENAKVVYKHLVDYGIIVRNVSKNNRCSQCLRITVGTPDENKKLINRLQNLK
jgi:histidinol-phosphate aminotransferase